MTQPTLLDIPDRREKKRGHVPATSVEAGRAVNRDKRMNGVLKELDYYGDCDPPTSAEMAHASWAHGLVIHTFQAEMAGEKSTMPSRVPLEFLMTYRRGLSDLLAAGFVEHGPARTCRVSGRACVTWKVKSR